MQNQFDRNDINKKCFVVKVAGIPIQIEAMYDYIYSCCKEYISTEKPLFSVCVSEEELDREAINGGIYYYVWKGYIKSNGNHEIKKLIHKGIIESVIIHRKIVEVVPAYNAFFMHGAVVSVNHYAYMFTGRSGTGKTTHIKKWIDNAKGSFVVNGDKPFVLVNREGVFACGSPWCGKENYGTNAIVPLRSIVFMERSTGNHIEKVSFKSIYLKLLEQTYQPSDADQMRKTLKLLTELKDHVSFYRFQFDNYKEDAFSVPYNFLTKEEIVCGI